jgi:hypothetical protein
MMKKNGTCCITTVFIRRVFLHITYKLEVLGQVTGNILIATQHLLSRWCGVNIEITIFGYVTRCIW